MRSSNVCAICKQKNLSVDFSKIKSYKIKNFIDSNRINKEDYSNILKICNCNKNVHKLCILLNILFNFEIKCPECNQFYNIKISKVTNNKEKCSIICFTAYLILIHLILYGICVSLIIFNINKYEMNDFKNTSNDKYIIAQYFFAIIIFIINSYLLYRSIISILDKFKYCFKCFININEKDSGNKIDDSKFFEPLYKFYRYFYNDRLSHLICKRNEIFFVNKICYNKDFQNLIKNNNLEFQHLSNGYKEYSNYNKTTQDEQLLRINNNNKNDKNKINLIKNSSSSLLNEEKRKYMN